MTENVNGPIGTSPLTKEGKKLPQYIAALSVCLGSLAAGGVLGWTGNISEDLKSLSYNDIKIDDNSLGWIGSIANLGAACGCIPIGKLCDLIGRRKAMLLLTIPFMLGWLLIIFAQTLSMLYIGRFLTGMAGCAFCVSAPIYTSEIAEKEVRGALGSYFELLLTVGIFLAYLLSIFLSIKIYTMCIASLPILFAIVFFFQPETPVYRIKKNKVTKAMKALTRLRGSCYDLDWEIEGIKQTLLDENFSKLSIFESIKTKTTQKAAFICFSLMLFQQASGINAVVFYCDTIFETAGSKLDPKVATLIIGIMQIIATFVSSTIVDKLGRRFLLITSNLIMSISTTALGIFFTLQERKLIDSDTLSTIGSLPVIALAVFVTLFSFGMGPICWMLPTEIFPSDVKSLGTGLAATLNWLTAFLVTKFYLDLQDTVGADVTFYLFSAVAMVATIFVYLFLPETKNKSLDNIQDELNNHGLIVPFSSQ